jgi:Holliday junction resolvase-like predicted endonuclease
MSFETDMLISLVRLTREGCVSQEKLNYQIRAPIEIRTRLLLTLQNEGLINLKDNIIGASDEQRLKIAFRALERGADIEVVSGLLQWKEFEAMVAVALETNGYSIVRNLRFKDHQRRYEIDVVGYKGSFVVCVDCKHWHHRIGKSTLRMVTNAQVERVRSLSKHFLDPRIKLRWPSDVALRFIPVIISLVVEEVRFYDGVPIVPILQLQDFLDQLPAFEDMMVKISSFDASKPPSNQRKLL